MRPFTFLLVVLLYGSEVAQAQPGLLQRRVQLAATNQPLGQVLREVARQSQVEFSYSSTLVPLQSRVTLRTSSPQALETVLTRLCATRGLSWQLVGSHVVVWRTAAGPLPLTASTSPASSPTRFLPGSNTAAPPATAGSTPSNASAASRRPLPAPRGEINKPLPAAATRPASLPAINSRTVAAPKSRPASALAKGAPRRAVPRLSPAPSTEKTARKVPAPLPVLAPLRPAPDTFATAASKADSAENRIAGTGRRLTQQLREEAALAAATVARAARRVGRSVEGIAPLAARRPPARTGLLPLDTLLSQVALPRPSPGIYYEKQAQATFISPLGTNALRSGRTNNGYSLNLLAGYAAGVRRLEIGGLLNVVRDTVRGVQLAGLANVVGTATTGVQAAGLANVLGGSMKGLQLAGLANVARDDARGLQVAGLVNVVGGAATAATDATRPVRLRRWLGLPRLLATNPVAATPDAPGLPSLQGPLVQAAGLANLTGTDVRGLQTAPLLNLGHRIRGAQLGLVNVARHVRGTQIGLINIADSVDGVAFGLLNIVRHGYRRGEVWVSETLPLNAVLKLGVPRYYTILGLASQPLGTRVRWASGFGIGTAGRPHGRLTYSLDLMQWALAEPGQEAAGEVRLLTQLRPALAWQIETNGHLQLIVSPTLNYALAVNKTNPPIWDFGENQLLLLNRRTSSAIYRLWPGLQVGLRF